METAKTEQEKINLRQEIKEKTLGYILTALGLVAGLAWNEAIKSLIDQFFPSLGGGVALKFIYAFLVTIIIVIASVSLLKIGQTNKIKK